MALIYNGTTIQPYYTVKYNGTSLKKIIYNGLTVWEAYLYLYNTGTENTSLHGGFNTYQRCGFGWGWYADNPSKYGTCTITRNTSTIKFDGPGNKYGSVMSAKAINLTNYTKLVIVVTAVTLVSSGGPRVGFASDASADFKGVYLQIGSAGTYTIDISSLTGNHYFAIAFQNACTMTVSQIYLM